jgi:hypothetical protein
VVVFVLVGCVNRDVELFPPALPSTVLDSSNIKWAMASLGWLGTVGIILLLPLNLKQSYNIGQDSIHLQRHAIFSSSTYYSYACICLLIIACKTIVSIKV